MGLELTEVCLPLLPESRDYRRAPPCSAGVWVPEEARRGYWVLLQLGLRHGDGAARVLLGSEPDLGFLNRVNYLAPHHSEGGKR